MKKAMNESLNELELLEILKILIPEGTNQGCSGDNGSISVKMRMVKLPLNVVTRKKRKIINYLMILLLKK